MSDGFAYLDILFFAAVAAFIAFRLRSVLGRRTGEERQRPDLFSRRAETSPGDSVVPLPERNRANEEPTGPAMPSATGVDLLRRHDRGFDPAGFVEGAKQAFAMIVTAFAAGDRETLRPLLAEPVFDRFDAAIAERDRVGETLETRLLDIKDARIVDAGMNGAMARVKVRFETEQVNVTRDAQGRIVSGDPDHPETIVDIWTFERDTRSTDPNWELVLTEAPA